MKTETATGTIENPATSDAARPPAADGDAARPPAADGDAARLPAADEQSFLKTIWLVLEGENPLSRLHGIRALARIGARDAHSLKRIIALLYDPDPDIRSEAAIALGHLGARDDANRRLENPSRSLDIRDRSLDIRDCSLDITDRLLDSLDHLLDSTDRLLESMESDPEGEVRIVATRALADIADPATLDRLLRCVEENGYPECDVMVDDLEFSACWDVQAEALRALGAIGEPRAAPGVIALLEQGGYEELEERGFDTLARLDSEAATRFLLDRLAAGEALSRRRAVRALSAAISEAGTSVSPPEPILTALADALHDEDPEVRMAAAAAMATSRLPLAAAALAPLLDDSDTRVRSEAVRLLAAMKAADAVPQLHDLLDASNSDRGGDAGGEIRWMLVRTLGEIGDPSSFERLVALLDTEDETLLFEVLGALGKITPPDATTDADSARSIEYRLADILADEDADDAVCMQAARTLGHLLAAVGGSVAGQSEADNADDAAPSTAPRDAPDTPRDALRAATCDASSQVAFAALEALVDADPDNAVKTLTEVLAGNASFLVGAGTTDDTSVDQTRPAAGDAAGDTATATAIAAAGAIETVRVPPEDENALVETLLGKDPKSSTLAAMLVRPAPRAQTDRPQEPVPADSTDDAPSSPNSRADANLAERPQAGRETAGADDHPHPPRETARVHAARLLGELPDPGPRAIETLIACLCEPNAALRREAMSALAHIGDAKALPAILDRLADPDREVRLAALRAAARLAGPDGLDQRLEHLLCDPDPAMREYMVRALGRSPEPMAPLHLAEALDDDDIGVCRAALAAVRHAPLDALMRSHLLQLLFRFSGDLRKDVAAALGRMRDATAMRVLLETLRDAREDEHHWICLDVLAEINANSSCEAEAVEVEKGERSLAI